MNELVHNRLLVLGSKRQVNLFALSHWERMLRPQFGDWLEHSAGRFICQFETEGSVLPRIKRLSQRWPRLIFLLDSEDEAKRIKSLAKAKAGVLEQCEISY
jgi:hypothetical protein